MQDDPTKNKFLGLPMLQVWSDLAIWEQFLNLYPLGSIVELGAYQGAFTIFLALQCRQRGIQFMSCDLNPPSAASTAIWSALGVKDCFFQCSYAEFRFVNRVEHHIARPRLIFCDNGDKPSEVAFYAPRLESGEFLVAHDWEHEIFQKHIPAHLVPLMVRECESPVSWTRWWRVP